MTVLMSYDKVFSERASSYLHAVNTYPHVMKNENKTIANSLDLAEGEKVLHVACAGVYIEPWFDVSCEYTRIEQNEVMAKLDNAKYCTLESIPYPDETFDKIVIAATLHHYSDEERNSFYSEVSRLLKSGGKFILCDVLKGSEQDALLNICVDTYNPGGHKGRFFTHEYADILNGYFRDINTSVHEYPWVFTSSDEFNQYCNKLFYLKKLDVKDTLDTISKYVTIRTFEDGTLHMNWRLLYFVCQK